MPRRQTLKSLPKAKSGARTNGSHKTAKTNGATRRHRTTTRKLGQMTGGGPLNGLRNWLGNKLRRKDPKVLVKGDANFANPAFGLDPSGKNNAPTNEEPFYEEVDNLISKPPDKPNPNEYDQPKGPIPEEFVTQIKTFNSVTTNYNSLQDGTYIVIITLEKIQYCCILNKNSSAAPEILLLYKLNACNESAQEGVKQNLNSGEYYVYLNSKNKIILCTNQQCFREGEPFVPNDCSFGFNLTKFSENPFITKFSDNNYKKYLKNIKYFKVPDSITAFDIPVFLDVCKNKLIYEKVSSGKKDKTYIELGEDGTTRPPPSENRYQLKKTKAEEKKSLTQNNWNPFTNAAKNTGYIQVGPNPSSHPAP